MSISFRFVALLLAIVLGGCGVGKSAAPSGESGEFHEEAGVAPTPSRVGEDCSPGSYVVSQADARTERSCSACPSGSFSAESNASHCVQWRECAPGSFVQREGSSTSDRVCATCETGTESQRPNQSACTQAGTCPAGSARRAGGSPADCEPCAPGSFCAGGSAPRLDCPDGTWDHDSNASTPCVDATHCLAGERVASAPTKLSDRTCTACLSGSFSANLNAPSCTAWTNCLPSTHVSVQGTSSHDRTCSPCPSGTVSTSMNQSAAYPQALVRPAQSNAWPRRQRPTPSASHALLGFTALAEKPPCLRVRLARLTTMPTAPRRASLGRAASPAKAVVPREPPSPIAPAQPAQAARSASSRTLPPAPPGRPANPAPE
jgi:hypothetical protein